MKKMNNRERTFFFMTVPILILFFAFNTLPLIKGFMYSFTNFRGYGSYDWVGLRNYADLFTDARVGHSYWFTIKFAVATTIVVNVISLVLALGLNSKIKFKSALRGMYFVPNILGALVVGYIFNFFFTYIVPALADMTGLQGLSSSILSSPNKAAASTCDISGLFSAATSPAATQRAAAKGEAIRASCLDTTLKLLTS